MMAKKSNSVSQIFRVNDFNCGSVVTTSATQTNNSNNHSLNVNKNIEQFIEKCHIDGKQWHRCKWLNCTYLTMRSDCMCRHMRRHTGERPYKCSICSYATIQSSALKIHMRRHTGEKPYKCNYENCGKRFTVLGTLLIHERTHTGIKPYKCKISKCGYATIERSKLSAHMRKNHNLIIDNPNQELAKALLPVNIFGTVSSASCENIQVEVDLPVYTLEKSISNNSEFNNNKSLVMINSEENSIKKVAHFIEKKEISGRVSYFCKWPNCSYDTNRSDCIVRHIRSHTGEKPYKCHYEHCDYATIQRSALKSHLIWHTGEKPHICPYQNCSYKSIKRNKLNQHITKNHLTTVNEHDISFDELIGNDVKRIGKFIQRKRLNWYECKYNNCGYSTSRSDCISRHMRTHTEDKPYKCSQLNCSYATIQSSSLKKHANRHSLPKH